MSPLPAVVAVTAAELAGDRSLEEVLAAAVDGGLRAVIVRDKDRPPDERRRLVAVAEALVRPLGGLVLVASDTGLGGDGVHLSATDPFPHLAPGDRRLVGRSCHSRHDVAAAAAEGCAYATLSPIFPSRSKPGYGPALGPGALGGHRLAVLALGGVDVTNAASCIRAGAAGVAVMGAVMAAPDPAAAAAALVEAAGASGRTPPRAG